MRILFPVIGFHEITAELANALSARHDVALLVLDGLYGLTANPAEFLDVLRSLAPRATICMMNHWRKRDPRTLATIWQAAKWIGAWKPDLIHVQEAYDYRLYLILSLVREIPLVLTVHDPKVHLGEEFKYQSPEKRLELALGRQIRRMADQIIVHGHTMREALVSMRQVQPGRIQVVPLFALNIIRRFAKNVAPEQPGTILFFGRIWEYKGLDYLIRAEPLITQQIPETQIIIAGTGENIRRYQEIMVNKERFVLYNEYISQEMVAHLFQMASVVALPYREATQSAVLATAYAFGKPVVASSVGTIPEYVEDGVTGYLVPPGDVDKLAEALVRLLRDPSLRRQMGQRAYDKAQGELSPTVIAGQTEEVYHSVIRKS